MGTPIDYVPAKYLCEDGWPLIPQSARDWATRAAGAPITDPVSGQRQAYWYCNISPDDRPSPSGLRAEFDLLMFGRRGLAVCSGTTEAFVASPAGSHWRQTRFDLPVDPARVRNDHRRDAPPNTGETRAAAGSGESSPGGGLLPKSLLDDFGNLPLATQRFLVEPFVVSTKRPQQSVLQAMTQTRGGRLFETIWTYFFNAHWLSFAYLQRSVAVMSNYDNEEMQSGSHEARALASTPWSLAAWVAPVVKAGPAAAPELGARRPGELR